MLIASGSAYVAGLNDLVLNPSKKFITAAQELRALNKAAIKVAAQLGGLQFTDTSLVTVANQADYLAPSNWIQIYYLEIVTNAATATETAKKVFVTPYQRMQDYAGGTQAPGGSDTFATFQRPARRLHFEPAPTVAGLQIRAQVFGMPNSFTNTNALVDGPPEQMAAVCAFAAADLRLFTRDIQEANNFMALGQAALEDAVMVRSGQNSTGQMAIGDINNPEHFRLYGG